MIQINDYANLIDSLPFGKTLPTAKYFHSHSINDLPSDLAKIIFACRKQYDIPDKYNVIKCFRREFKISFLSYPEFFSAPHPSLNEAISIDLATGKHRYHDYTASLNPPILHRKEEFLPPLHPKRLEFAQLTLLEESHGLLEEKSRIGFRLGWESALHAKGLSFQGTKLVKLKGSKKTEPSDNQTTIRRHRTAIPRTNLSKPVQSLLDYGLIGKGFTFFDYGCGQGDDIRLLSELGINARGWDPVFQSAAPKKSADVVNLGFVLNVIEDPIERIQTLRDAYTLAERLLVVSIITVPQERIFGKPYLDGFLTSRGTFQKYFSQAEIRQFIEDVLDVSTVAIGLGVFLVFRNPSDLQEFIQSRTRRRIDWNSICSKLIRPARSAQFQLKFIENKELLESFWNRMLDLGRIPRPDEFDRYQELNQRIGSGNRARGILLALYGDEALKSAQQEKMNDWLVFLALVNFRKRIPFSHFSRQQQTDIRTFFDSYAEALNAGQKLLYQIADSEQIANKCDTAGIGWCDEQALYLHRDLVDSLDPLLRVYIGCGETLFGDLRQADLVKIHKRSSKLTMLKYDNYDAQSLPELETRTKINLRNQVVDVFDHRNPERTQLLYQKERFVSTFHPNRRRWEAFSRKFAKLGINVSAGLGPTKQELKAILLDYGLSLAMRRLRK